MRIESRSSLGRPFGSATVGEFCAPVAPGRREPFGYHSLRLLIRLAKSSMRLSTIDLYDLLRMKCPGFIFVGT
jgi:hypothetical protein